MRARVLLLAASLVLPAFSQVWQPGGIQIRVQRPNRAPGTLDTFKILLGFSDPGLTRPSAPLFTNFSAFPGIIGWRGQERSLERVDTQGEISELSSPKALDLCMGSLNSWEGTAYALGRRRHPASDRADSPSQQNRRSLELWVSRDFKTWEPFARYSPKYSGDMLHALLPLEKNKFIGPLWSNPAGLAIFHREASGRLVQECVMESSPPFPWICRSPKGIVLFDNREVHLGQYQVLDNRDAHLLRQGQLNWPLQERIRLLTILVRPDGNLLVLAGRGPWESPFLLSYNDKEKRESNQMALGILNAKARREEPPWPSTASFRWFILNPETGQQTAVPPPEGFPKTVNHDMRALQFRDPQHLDW